MKNNSQTSFTFTFRCSMFWAFSLYYTMTYKLTLADFGFDAQCFELFLYLSPELRCFIEKQVSMLNVLSFFFIYGFFEPTKKVGKKVSMLNVLSFFFMGLDWKTNRTARKMFRCSMFWAFSLSSVAVSLSGYDFTGFDAQCFELFLYNLAWCLWCQMLDVSMLNVLSFFFIYQSKSGYEKTVIFVSMLNVLSFFFIWPQLKTLQL